MSGLLLANYENKIRTVGQQLFDQITQLPKEVRNAETEAKGINIFVREIWTDNMAENMIMVPICAPSTFATILSIEKAVRSESLGHFSSGNSENKKLLKYFGSVTFVFEERYFQCSTSGLKSIEDVVVDVVVFSSIFNVAVQKVIKQIEGNDGLLPKGLSDPTHYCCKLLQEWWFL